MVLRMRARAEVISPRIGNKRPPQAAIAPNNPRNLRNQRQIVRFKSVRAIMWKFAPASDSDGHPLLRSLNGNKGRQVWVYDPEAGTSEERAAVDNARAAFAANRHHQKHSSDQLLR
jgi:hypothetical protein